MDKELTLDNLLKFLCGEESINGRWFGEYYDGEPSFWWRPELKLLIESYVTTRVKEAERQAAENIINELISKGAFAQDFEVKKLLKTIRTALTTTTSSKEEKV